MELPIERGVRNAAKVATRSTDFFEVFSSAISIFMFIDFYLTVIGFSFNNSNIFKFSNFQIFKFSNSLLFLFFSINNYCNRSIINQLYFHHCTKLAGSDFFSQKLRNPVDKIVIEWDRNIGISSPDV